MTKIKKLQKYILLNRKYFMYCKKVIIPCFNTFFEKKNSLFCKFYVMAKRTAGNFFIKRSKYAKTLCRNFFFQALKNLKSGNNNFKKYPSKFKFQKTPRLLLSFDLGKRKFNYKNKKFNKNKKKFNTITNTFDRYSKSFRNSFSHQYKKFTLQPHFHFIKKARIGVKVSLVRRELESIKNSFLYIKQQNKKFLRRKFLRVSLISLKNKRIKLKRLVAMKKPFSFKRKGFRIKLYLSSNFNRNKFFKKFKNLKKNKVYLKNRNKVNKLNNQKKKCYVLFCKKKKNNFFLTLTNTKGEVILKKSAGTSGLKKKKQKKSKESIKIISRDLAKSIKKINIETIFRIYIIDCFEKIGNFIL